MGSQGSWGSRGSRGPGRWGSLRGGLGVGIIAAAAMIGAIATVATGTQPGTLLGAAVLAGTVAAALIIQPRAGRMIFPAPALCYLVAALAAGVIYDRSADRTVLAIDATQWIASGFFLMALATLLAIVMVRPAPEIGEEHRSLAQAKLNAFLQAEFPTTQSSDFLPSATWQTRSPRWPTLVPLISS